MVLRYGPLAYTMFCFAAGQKFEYFHRSNRFQLLLMRPHAPAKSRKPLRPAGLKFTVEIGGLQSIFSSPSARK